MTITNTVTKLAYSTNGATTVWPFSFPLDRDSDLMMVLTSPGGVEETISPGRYRVERSSGSVGGTVLYPLTGPALPMGHTVTLLRRLPVTQSTDLVTGAAFYAEDLERALDRQTMIDQQQQEEIGRALKIPVSDLPNGVTFPPVANRANRVLAFDGAGGVTVSSFTLKQIESGATTELSAQDAQNAAVEADAARDVVLIQKADFDPKYADFSGKYADFAPKYSLFTPSYADFAAKYADFVPKHTIAQAQWPTVQMAAKWAEEAEDVEVLPGQYSARHWARKSAAVVLGGTTVISSNDKVPDFLGNKLLAGNGIALGVATAGSGQTMTVTNTAVPKFYTRASAALAQNASLTLATPGVKDGEGLKRVVSVFEETVGTALTDSATDFDMADEAQFAFRAYTPNTAVTLVGNEKTGPVSVASMPQYHSSEWRACKLEDSGARALLVRLDRDTSTARAAVVTRTAAGTYSLGADTVIGVGNSPEFQLVRLSPSTVVLCYQTGNTTPVVWFMRVLSVDAAGTITVGSAQTLRNSGGSYGVNYATFAPVSATEFAVATVDVNGSTYTLNIGRVTVSGGAATAGTWTAVSSSSAYINLGALAVLRPGVAALLWIDGAGSQRHWLRLIDLTTPAYTPGGAAVQIPGTSGRYAPAIVRLAEDRFACISFGGNPHAVYAQALTYSGIASPMLVGGEVLLSAETSMGYQNVCDAVIYPEPYKPVLMAWSTKSDPYSVMYLSLGLNGSGAVSVTTTQSVPLTSLYNVSTYSPYTTNAHWLCADGYITTFASQYALNSVMAVEFRPSLTATLATGAWTADDQGRAVVAAGGVAKITAVSGATAELSTLSAFSSTGTFTAGTWALRDAALYGGKVQTVKAVPAVVRTTKDSSLWEALTGLSASASGAVKLAWSFGDGRDWVVWDGSARRIIATNRASVHGGIDFQWMVCNDGGSWVFPPEARSHSALETAFAYTANQTAPAVYASLGAAGFAALGFTKSMTGTVRVGFWLPSGGSFDQLTLTYTGRSAWKRAESGYSIDYGREDQVVITRTASGTASVFATVMHVETT